MKKFWIQVIGLTLVIFAGFYVYQNPNIVNSLFPGNTVLKETKIQVGTNIIKVEIANTAAERTKGLSGRDSIASDSGMLFIFESSKKYQFWMKGMKFPIDVIFINAGKVVDFLKNVAPPPPNQKDSDLPLLQPATEIDMVLEVPSGYIDQKGVKNGDDVLLIK